MNKCKYTHLKNITLLYNNITFRLYIKIVFRYKILNQVETPENKLDFLNEFLYTF